jgi:predicted ATPase
MMDSNQGLSPGIRTHDQRLRVFVSSTLGELEAERRSSRAAIEQLRLHPVMFETGARPHPAQAVYQAYLDQSDVFVGIYWQSYGWIGPGADISGLEDELRLAGRMPRLLYVKCPAPEIEPGLSRMLRQIQSEGGLTYKTFADAGELRELLVSDLATLLSEHFGDTRRDGGESKVPVPVTALVGRDQEVAEVASLVSADDHRLVVLTGAGGVGKTRLALAVLEQTRPHWQGGVALADLSRVSDPWLVPETITIALGFARQGRETPLDTLGRRLAGKHMLVVLDDFDQVLEAAPVVAELLQRAPRLHLLVTSRVVLRVRGEREWRVEPLLLPPGDGDPGGTPAVRLLVDRIRDVQRGFELTSDNAAAITETCRRLDGLPLALELAATWMRVLTPQQLLQQLDEHMERRGALIDLPDRQQTMTATIDWSYQRLPQAARQMLARLTVFAAPFTKDAAEAVSGHDAAAAAESLALLVDHNMVSPAERPDGERAFAMLNLINRFASERLEDPDDTLGRLEGYLLGVLERAGAQHGSQDWARRLLDSESPNLPVVLRWAAERQRPSGELLRRVGDAWVWLVVRGHLRWASGLSKRIESWPAAGLGNERDAMARHWLTTIALLDDGRFAQAGALIDEILPDARRLEQPSRWVVMLLVRALSRPYAAGSPARGEFEEALAVARDAGDPVVLGYALSRFGLFLSLDGDPARARDMHEEMLGIACSLGDENQRAEAHYGLAMDVLAAGGPGPAGSHLAAAARWFTDIDNRDGLGRCLGALAAVALRRKRAHLAARLVGAAAAVRVIGLTPYPTVAEAEDRVIKQIRAALQDSEFTADVAKGRADTAEAALAAAWAALEDGANEADKPSS